MNLERSLEEDNIASILKGITIPSPPQIIADLQMEMAMPEPDIKELADMISKDPGISGGVLKTLNSPFYGHRDVSSISTGVMMLGMNTIANIVNTLYLQDCMAKNTNISDELSKAMTRFWDSAADVARACLLVAKKLRFKNPDLAYMLGLFHNVGIPLLMQRFADYPEIIVRSYQCEGGRIVDVENEHYKTNHAVVSFYAARSWKLPAILCKVIGEHHNVFEIFSEKDTTDTEEKTYLAILKLGEHLAGLSLTLGNSENDIEWQLSKDDILDYVGLSQYDFDDLVGEAADNGIGGHGYFI
jgi:HD-like signal output (HDOD) protein